MLSFKIIDEVFECFGVEDEQLQKALVVHKDDLLHLENEQSPVESKRQTPTGLFYKKE